MRRIVVDVTQDDIDNGIAHSPVCCPLARAINRSLVTRRTRVYSVSALILERTYMLSGPARRFVADVDGGYPVTPSRFALTEAS